MVAIFGSVGEVNFHEMAAIGRRLGHHGNEEVIWSPSPRVALGWRLCGTEAAIGHPPSTPLTFAGSILNRQELAGLVGRPADEESCAADARQLYELYLKLGVDGFAEVNGQFALALLDPDRQTVVLAVDRWAVQPLYFAPRGDCVVFASECKALLAVPDLPARMNRAAIEHVQATKYLPRSQGLLAHLYPVAPGSWVRLRTKGWEAGSYRPINLAPQPDKGERAHASELRATILAATRRLVRNVDPIGIALSAGLDSTLTLGAVRAVAPEATIHTFTASYQRDDPDLRLAAETARYYNTIHQEILISAADLPRLLPELVWITEQPIAREEMVVYQLVAEEAARHVPLILYGTMADKLFAGMPRHLLVKAAGDLPWLRSPLADFYNYTQYGRSPRTFLGKLLVMAYYRGRQFVAPHVQDAASLMCEKGLTIAPIEPLNAALLTSLESPTEATAMERLHSRVGVRYGSIFHDRDVASYAFQIPDKLKIRWRSRKYILHLAAKGILPPHLADRPKGLIRMARGPQLVRILEAMGDQLLAPDAVTRRGLFDRQEIARVRQSPPHGSYRDDQFYHLWTLLLTEIWAQTFVDGRGAGPVSLAADS